MDVVTLRRTWLAPLFFFQIYLTVSVVLFFAGPWPWEVEHPIWLACYLFAAQLMIAIGYFMSWDGARSALLPESDREREIELTLVYLRRALMVSLVLLIPTALSRTGSAFPAVVEGLRDTGAAYNRNFARLQEGNPFLVVEYIRIALAPYFLAVFPITVVLWGRLSKHMRVLACFVIAFNLAIYIATGTNKGFADFVVTLPWLVFLGVAARTLRVRVPRKLLVPIFLLLFVAFLQFFGAGQAQREGGVGEMGVLNTGAGLLEADPMHFVSRGLSDSGRIIFESITRYLGQGYYALSMAFGIDHASTLGFGHSMFLARNADAIFGTDHFTAGSLPGLLEERTGWGMLALWHSIYPWLASDVGFAGALLVMGLFAYLFGLSWGCSLATLRAHWILMAFMMIILFFYIPANNQIFQNAETCAAFFMVCFSLLWRRWRRTSAIKPAGAAQGGGQA
ncbi:membrane hypothetical protein [Cupriavidus taiwanensis]|uniref:hypothetical protein n=1 Tax=Cupriavidus taiwanensis TaxID=164546 RepID=UPI000E1858A7|nr:hypothetical protein [Cupriavidus taiwanensis]SOZ13909.1 membrane hypothetical protein [Cupriavidus taiwanensis]SOZ24621.1 membrane hypothetical protein [Cupriavidus taiwanensis]SOZ44522.1 membrane hypothetical protein [Cupriavidus taiwanensis]